MDSIIADIIIILATIALLAAAGTTAYSVLRSMKANKRPKMENGVPVRMIGLCTAGGTLLVALPTLFLGSMTDMCIITSIVMLSVASCAVICGRILTAMIRKRV